MLSNTIEDYLESIYNIISRKGYARTKDISRDLGVSPPSVTEMLKKLKKLKLVNYEKYSGVTLTKKGEKIARAIKTRHETLRRLLKIVLISDKIANEDACKLEHELSSETIEQLTKFVKFVENASLHPKWLEHFREFCKTGMYPEECEEKEH